MRRRCKPTDLGGRTRLPYRSEPRPAERLNKRPFGPRTSVPRPPLEAFHVAVTYYSGGAVTLRRRPGRRHQTNTGMTTDDGHAASVLAAQCPPHPLRSTPPRALVPSFSSPIVIPELVLHGRDAHGSSQITMKPRTKMTSTNTSLTPRPATSP